MLLVSELGPGREGERESGLSAAHALTTLHILVRMDGEICDGGKKCLGTGLGKKEGHAWKISQACKRENRIWRESLKSSFSQGLGKAAE